MAYMSAEQIAQSLEKSRKNGNGWVACCPAHEDNNPSLSITQSSDKVLFHCHAGCAQEEVIEALKQRGLWSNSESPHREKDFQNTDPNYQKFDKLLAEYYYTEDDGITIRYRVQKWLDSNQEKTFVQQKHFGNGQFANGLFGTLTTIYKAKDVIDAVARGETIFILEGEKDAETAINQLGVTATCNTGGSGKFKAEFAKYFKNANVIIVADNDEPGKKHAEDVAKKLRAVAKKVKVTSCPVGKDLTEWVELGVSKEDALDYFLAPTLKAINLPLWTKSEPPPRLWLEEEWIPQNATTLLVGTGGVGKSLLAQGFATRWAAGKQALSDKQGFEYNVLMVSCEDPPDELWRRQVDICKYNQIDLASLDKKLHILDRVSHDNILCAFDKGLPRWQPFYYDLVEYVADCNIHVLIMDNTAQLFGGQENAREQVTPFVNGVHAIFHKAGQQGTTILLSHPGKSTTSEYSGSTAWNSSVRQRLWLTRRKPTGNDKDDLDAVQEGTDSHSRFLSVRKANYGFAQDIELAWQDGCIAPLKNIAGDIYTKKVRKDELPLFVLQNIQTLTDVYKIKTISSAKTANNSLNSLLKKHSLKNHYSSDELSTTISNLIQAGIICIKEIGKGSNGKEQTTLFLTDQALDMIKRHDCRGF